MTSLQRAPVRPNRMVAQARLMRVINVPMRLILGLPFATPLSRQLMLLHLTGRNRSSALPAGPFCRSVSQARYARIARSPITGPRGGWSSQDRRRRASEARPDGRWLADISAHAWLCTARSWSSVPIFGTSSACADAEIWRTRDLRNFFADVTRHPAGSPARSSRAVRARDTRGRGACARNRGRSRGTVSVLA
jgi:hypothetical protein